ncbi:MAG: hypothetical protein HQK55_09445 [Deltaproteobacteria bacterium]|nr:hypothetical protein [Deltaproteobacteria bacterium]
MPNSPSILSGRPTRKEKNKRNNRPLVPVPEVGTLGSRAGPLALDPTPPRTGKKNLNVKIAVASSDGVTVNEHFGRAQSFRIYRLRDDGHDFLELREISPVNESPPGSDEPMKQVLQHITDCSGVVATKIGPGAIKALVGSQIFAFTMSSSIDDALRSLRALRRFIYLK